MCGIVGAVAERDVVHFLVDGLKRLEYRGYDSAGIAVMSDSIKRVRRTGRVAEMEAAAQAEALTGQVGIGHTRWATHGGVTELNAHPHISSGELALVHNGIIENHEQQRERLRALGYVFESQTDTEVIGHLVHHYYAESGNLLTATRRAVKDLEGAYAIAVIHRNEPKRLIAARMGCPLLVGLGEGENFIASDVSAVLSATRDVIFLEEGDVADVTLAGVQVYDADGNTITRPVHRSDVSLASMELGPYSHFMQKEIHEQPRALADTIEPIMGEGFSPSLFGEDAATLLADVHSVQILACGTSYYAGLIARYWMEAVAGIPCSVEIASEYRYLKYAKSLGQDKTLSICNVQESAIPRASRMVFYTRAGAEIGVASTKAFTTQLIALFALVGTLAKLHGRLDATREKALLDDLRLLPGSVQAALNLEPQIIA
jgi:glucosamine--fructose-6-phosphate aminotransferase (isomerizing)